MDHMLNDDCVTFDSIDDDVFADGNAAQSRAQIAPVATNVWVQTEPVNGVIDLLVVLRSGFSVPFISV